MGINVGLHQKCNTLVVLVTSTGLSHEVIKQNPALLLFPLPSSETLKKIVEESCKFRTSTFMKT